MLRQNGHKKVSAVLFLCAMNAIRSPMAEALTRHYFEKSLYVKSAGVRKGYLDPFTVTVLDEVSISIAGYQSQTIEELADWEGFNFDLIITLSPEAHHQALELTRTLAVDVEYWPTLDPSENQGSREQKLAAYREVREYLGERILARFGE